MGIGGRSHITISYLGHFAGVLGLIGCLALHWEDRQLRSQLADLQIELEGLRTRDPGVEQRQISPGGGEDPEPTGPSSAKGKEPGFERSFWFQPRAIRGFPLGSKGGSLSGSTTYWAYSLYTLAAPTATSGRASRSGSSQSCAAKRGAGCETASRDPAQTSWL